MQQQITKIWYSWRSLFSFKVKGAAKLYFIYYLCVVIILFSTGLFKSVFSTFSFEKLGFSVFLCFLSLLGFEFDVIWLIIQVLFYIFLTL